MTKLSAMPIYGKKKIFSITSGKTWYVALGLGPIIVCSNYNPGLTLTYSMPRSHYFGSLGSNMGKSGGVLGFFFNGNYCSL